MLSVSYSKHAKRSPAPCKPSSTPDQREWDPATHPSLPSPFPAAHPKVTNIFANMDRPHKALGQLLQAAFSNRFAMWLGSDLCFSTVYQHFPILHNHHPQNWVFFCQLGGHMKLSEATPQSSGHIPHCRNICSLQVQRKTSLKHNSVKLLLKAGNPPFAADGCGF